MKKGIVNLFLINFKFIVILSVGNIVLIILNICNILLFIIFNILFIVFGLK